MKKLIFLPLFLSFSVVANEMNPGETRQIVSTIKDIEVTELLQKTSEFSKCREMNKFEASDGPTERDNKIKKAEDCFKQELAKNKDPEKLKKLSEALNLQHYGLVKSDKVKEIQEYLNDKMYESMTGVKRSELKGKQLIEALKFGKRKHIDQRTFIELYKTQLTKNALYEVSRYCFENFRNVTNTSATNFGDHWAGFNKNYPVTDVTDTGTPPFGDFSQTGDDKTKIYQQMFSSMKVGGNGFPTDQLSDFFIFCGLQITNLCKHFKDNNSEVQDTQNSDTTAGIATNPPNQTGTQNSNAGSKGAVSCLVQSRLQEIKRAIAAADKIEKEVFDKELAANPDHLAGLLAGNTVKIYGSGQDSSEESFDNLTNYTSKDIIEGKGGYGKDALAEKTAEKCKANPELKECEDYFIGEETLDKVKHNVEQEMTLQREVEIARVRQLKEDGEKGLEEYLKENGHFKIWEEYKDPKVQKGPNWLEEQIGLQFEAKKVAALHEINSKLGRRQLHEDPTQKKQDLGNVGTIIKDSQEERARLAQVVLFNNIITSHLTVRRENSTENMRNVNPWKKEESALEGAKVDPSLFSNLKTDDSGSNTNNVGQNDQLGGIQFIDEILGKQKDP